MSLLILIVLILAVVVPNIRIVPQAHCYVIERLGQFKAVWDAGLHVKVPFIDRVVAKISLKEQVLDFPPQAVITKDNVTMTIDSVVYAMVYDPVKYTYGVEDAMSGLQNLTATTLRSVIGDMELDQTLSSRADINMRMQAILDEATDPWGLKVTRVEIKNIQPPKAIEEVMTKQMRAERERRQTVLEAQAHQEAVVARAKGDKEAKVLAAEAERDAQIALAEGRAQAIEKVYTAEANGLRQLIEANISENVLRLKSIEALKDVADGQATKIYIPNSLSDNFASFGVIGDLLGTDDGVQNAVPRDIKRAQEAAAMAEAFVEADSCLDDDSTYASSTAAYQSALSSAEMAQQSIEEELEMSTTGKKYGFASGNEYVKM